MIITSIFVLSAFIDSDVKRSDARLVPNLQTGVILHPRDYTAISSDLSFLARSEALRLLLQCSLRVRRHYYRVMQSPVSLDHNVLIHRRFDPDGDSAGCTVVNMAAGRIVLPMTMVRIRTCSHLNSVRSGLTPAIGSWFGAGDRL